MEHMPGEGRESITLSTPPSGLEKREKLRYGYALAIGSCERADNVDACTAAAPDVITAFAVPNPGCSSQS